MRDARRPRLPGTTEADSDRVQRSSQDMTSLLTAVDRKHHKSKLSGTLGEGAEDPEIQFVVEVVLPVVTQSIHASDGVHICCSAWRWIWCDLEFSVAGGDSSVGLGQRRNVQHIQEWAARPSIRECIYCSAGRWFYCDLRSC